MSVKDGGPAFPVLEEYSQFNDSIGRYEDHYAPVGGMTLRDYFAAKAMQALLSSASISQEVAHHVNTASDAFGTQPANTIARMAWSFADAMLAERSKP